MERPLKRQRINSYSVPEEDLLQRREHNDLQLKSRFEAIFEKYGKDFDGVGDEVDLETGRIIVNNGHLMSMANEHDAGKYHDDYDEYDEEHKLENSSDSDDWSDDNGMLTSTLLLKFQERIKALGRRKIREPSKQESRSAPHSDDGDSLMGDPEPVVKEEEGDGREGAINKNKLEPRNLQNGHLHWSLSPRKSAPLDQSPVEPAWFIPIIPQDNRIYRDDSKRREKRKAPKGTSHLQDTASTPTETMTSSMAYEKMDRSKILDDSAASTEHPADMPVKNPTNKSDHVERALWTKAEDAELQRLMTEETPLGWKQIALRFPSRPTRAVMLHWTRRMKRLARRGESGPTEPPFINHAACSSKNVSSNRSDSDIRSDRKQLQDNTATKTEESSDPSPEQGFSRDMLPMPMSKSDSSPPTSDDISVQDLPVKTFSSNKNSKPDRVFTDFKAYGPPLLPTSKIGPHYKQSHGHSFQPHGPIETNQLESNSGKEGSVKKNVRKSAGDNSESTLLVMSHHASSKTSGDSSKVAFQESRVNSIGPSTRQQEAKPMGKATLDVDDSDDELLAPAIRDRPPKPQIQQQSRTQLLSTMRLEPGAQIRCG